MKRALLDLNVVLDVLLDRAPFAEPAAAVWAEIELGRAEGLLAAHSITTLHYLVAKARGRAFAERCVADVLGVFAVAPVDADVLRGALSLGWTDFADAVTAQAALSTGCHFVATRDPKGFPRAPLPVVDPTTALSLLRADS